MTPTPAGRSAYTGLPAPSSPSRFQWPSSSDRTRSSRQARSRSAAEGSARVGHDWNPDPSRAPSAPLAKRAYDRGGPRVLQGCADTSPALDAATLAVLPTGRHRRSTRARGRTTGRSETAASIAHSSAHAVPASPIHPRANGGLERNGETWENIATAVPRPPTTRPAPRTRSERPGPHLRLSALPYLRSDRTRLRRG
jgi:hypothetical protein